MTGHTPICPFRLHHLHHNCHQHHQWQKKIRSLNFVSLWEIFLSALDVETDTQSLQYLLMIFVCTSPVTATTNCFNCLPLFRYQRGRNSQVDGYPRWKKGYCSRQHFCMVASYTGSCHLRQHHLPVQYLPITWWVSFQANVTPVPKSGDMHLANNFRPVSVIPVLAKVFWDCCSSSVMWIPGVTWTLEPSPVRFPPLS